MKIFDCSNSVYRQPHCMSGGPMQNDVMRYLDFYSRAYGFTFTPFLEQANVVITNDVFTPEALASGLPRVKRMDGIFFQKQRAESNQLLNLAAQQADIVVFISEFSRAALSQLYPDVKLKNSLVALNAVDPADFSPAQDFWKTSVTSVPQFMRWASTASRWDRTEKRLQHVFDLARLRPQDEFVLIGTFNDAELLNNMVSTGYLDTDNKICEVLRTCDAYFHPAYRDAAPKTVGQALACGLPVLGAASGGLPELVGPYGVLIEEPTTSVLVETQLLSGEALSAGLKKFRANYAKLKTAIRGFPAFPRFDEMLEVYVQAIWFAARK